MTASARTRLDFDEASGLYLWDKSYDAELTPHFRSCEFVCHCRDQNCGLQMISEELVSRLERVRIKLAAPIVVTSAYRCSRQQERLRSMGFETAVGTSQHELGRAADLFTNDIQKLAEIVEEEGFPAIGMAKTFIHVDLRSDKKRRWTYK